LFRLVDRNKTNRAAKPGALRRGGLFALWFLLLAFVMLVGIAGTDRDTHMIVTLVICLVLLVLRFQYRSQWLRVAFLVLAGYLSLSYFYWRTTSTLEFYDWVSFSVAITLFVAELYGLFLYFLTVAINAQPLHRKPAPLPANPADYPSVDVLVPSYNEDSSILEVTLLAALQIRYPEDKLKVYLLDDGGTDQFCAHEDQERAVHARQRRSELKSLCEKVGARYLTRKRNLHAKAGNLNNGLEHSDGDLVLVLDADHVPTRDILENTVGWFVRDPRMFLVQTPHFFVNPDPIEKNLGTFAYMPSENEMFYRVIQKGLDSWNGTFFCGSAAVLRRSCLEEVGGFKGESITEDAETALTLHAAGYHSAYIEKPMISGLAPESLDGFIQQRIRWAQGMVQIFLLKNPLFLKGLTFPQRLCYTSSCFFWFFPFARLAFIVAPSAFLIFGLKIYAATAMGFFIYALPHVFAVLLVSDYLFGRVRWLFVSEVYELIQSIHTLPAILGTFLRPRAPVFKVTAKGETLERDHISSHSLPFYILLAINVGALALGWYRIATGTVVVEAAFVTMGWAVFNSVLLLACIGVMLERRQLRATPRMPVSKPTHLTLRGETYPAEIVELSNGGVGMMVPAVCERMIRPGDPAVFALPTEPGGPSCDFHVRLRRLDWAGMKLRMGFQFDHQTAAEVGNKVSLVNGSSDRWEYFQRHRESRKGVLGGFWFVVLIGLRSTLAHLWVLLTGGRRRGDRNPRDEFSDPDLMSAEVEQDASAVGGLGETPDPFLKRSGSARTSSRVGSVSRRGLVGVGLFGVLLFVLTSGMMASDRGDGYDMSWIEAQPAVVEEVPAEPPVAQGERRSVMPQQAPEGVEAPDPWWIRGQPVDPAAVSERQRVENLESGRFLPDFPGVEVNQSGALVLSDLPTLLNQMEWDEAVFHLCLPGASPMRDHHLTWGALMAQGLALRLGDSPLMLTQSSALRRGRHNVVIGTTLDIYPFLAAVNMVPLQGPFATIHPLPGDERHFILILSGRDSGQVRDAVLAFARGELPEVAVSYARLDRQVARPAQDPGDQAEIRRNLRLPDLAMLPQSGQPLGGGRGYGTAVKVGSGDSMTVTAAWTFLGQVARSAGAPLEFADYSFGDPVDERDLLVIGVAESLGRSIISDPLDAPSDVAWLEWLSRRLGAGRLFYGKDHPLLFLEQEWTHSQCSILQFESPFSSGRSLTLVTARKPEILLSGVRTLQQDGLWYRIDGDFNAWLPYRPGTLSTAKVGRTFPETQRTVLRDFFSRWIDLLTASPGRLALYIIVVLFLFSWTTSRLLGKRRTRDELSYLTEP